MCVVSMIGDGWTQQFPDRWPNINPSQPLGQIPDNGITRQEFDALKREVQELRELLIAAKKFDEETGQPNCEVDEKVKLIKDIARIVGVSMEDVFA